MMKQNIHGNGGKSRHHPKRCTLVIYHLGSVLLSIGIIVTIIGVATPRLFHVYIYDHRKPSTFHHVHIPVGIFSISAKVTWLSMKQSPLPYDLQVDDPRWTVAKVTTVIGLLSAIGALILHIILACCKTNHTWPNILIEVGLLLISVIAILIGLSFAETEIEYIHDHGDLALSRMLAQNGLLGSYSDPIHDSDISVSGNLNQHKSSDQIIPKADITDFEFIGSSGDFALFLTPPLMSFFLLISADFLYLLSFLAVLTYFVRVCEKAEQDRKQMRSAVISQS